MCVQLTRCDRNCTHDSQKGRTLTVIRDSSDSQQSDCGSALNLVVDDSHSCDFFHTCEDSLLLQCSIIYVKLKLA